MAAAHADTLFDGDDHDAFALTITMVVGNVPVSVVALSPAPARGWESLGSRLGLLHAVVQMRKRRCQSLSAINRRTAAGQPAFSSANLPFSCSTKRR